ncbi:MAG: CUAEP/CCAEP-tail radical SAM protein, partial [Gammaproteobacteria bacterium]
MHIVLINPYELGRQSFGLAHATAWLKADGHTVECIDLAHSKLEKNQFTNADMVAIQLAMHTATRIAEQAFARIQQWAPNATLVAFGLYAHVNSEWLKTIGVEHAFGGEFEADL